MNKDINNGANKATEDMFNFAAKTIRGLPDTLTVQTSVPATELSIKRDNLLLVPYIIPTRNGRSLTTKIIVGIKLVISSDGYTEEIDATSCNGDKNAVVNTVLDKISHKNDHAELIAASLADGYDQFVTYHLDTLNDALVANFNTPKATSTTIYNQLHVLTTLIITLTLSIFLCSPSPVHAWQTFSYEGGVMQNGNISTGVAIKLGPAGIAFGLGDQSDVDTKRMSELPFNSAATGINPANTTKLNHKRTDASWGFDLRYHYDFGKTVSLYAGPGLYWNEYRNLTLVTQQTSGSSYAPGYLFTERKRNELEVTGNGGILINVLSNEMWGLTLGAGYHTYRGAYLSLGLSYF